MGNPLAADLDHILAHTAGLWDEFRGRRIFITGGTGFIGCWLLESFLWANDRLGLGASATVLTRDPESFRGKAPHLAAHPAIRLHTGDVRSFRYPDGQFSHVIHAASAARERPNEQDPLEMLDTIIAGTRQVLDFAVACGAGKFLLTSSGGVYGKQPPELPHLPETYAGGPDTMEPASAYREGKRLAELLCASYHSRYGLGTKIARGFAFVGPYLPLDAQYAIGSFIRDAISGRPIRVSGDGRPVRSYLYAADMAIWLWTILLKGQPGRPYNVGSEADLTVGDLAHRVAEAAGDARVEMAGRPEPGARAPRYVPSTARARAELGLEEWVPLDEAIRRTAEWAKKEAVR
ncbi:MAG: NAD-dependent epimerase/dehydratase family protein [Bryobacteraceae bacterium]|jgi:dTDP-glucose 4,6-dehydratase